MCNEDCHKYKSRHSHDRHDMTCLNFIGDKNIRLQLVDCRQYCKLIKNTHSKVVIILHHPGRS